MHGTIVVLLALVAVASCKSLSVAHKLNLADFQRSAQKRQIAAIGQAYAAVQHAIKTGKESHKGFAAQQQEQPSEECQKAFQVVQGCASWFEQLGNSEGDFDAATFCPNECTRKVLNIPPECLGSAASGFSMFKFLCESDGHGGYCGSTFMEGFADFGECENYYSQSTCGEHTDKCTWSAEGSGECRMKFTPAALDKICTPCLYSLIKALSEVSIGIPTEALAMFEKLVCSKIDGTYCMVELQDAVEDLNGPPDQEMLVSFCTSPTRLACFRRILPFVTDSENTNAGTQARQCADYELASRPGISDDAKQKVLEERCLPCFRDAVNQQRFTDEMLGMLCTKNSEGEYCIPKLKGDDEDNEELDTCVGQIFGGECSTACDAVVEAKVDQYGCCLGIVQKMMDIKAANLTDRDIRNFERATENAGSNSVARSARALLQQDGDHGQCGGGEGFSFTFLKVCPSQENIEDTLNNGCTRPKGTVKIPKELIVNLNCDAVEADADRKAVILESLIADVATGPGVSSDSIVDPELICLLTARVRRQLLQGGGNKMKFTFAFQAETDAQSTAAAELFTELASSDALVLSNTEATVQNECASTCVEEDANLYDSDDQPSSAVTAGISLLVTLLAALVAGL